MADSQDRPTSNDAATFVELVDDVRTCMLTTVASDGSIHSRPMIPQATDEDGTVWFLTLADSPKVDHLRDDASVNLVYVDGETFVSASGTASTVDDDARKKDLWNPFVESWFQTKPSDPNVVLVKVAVSGAEYWDSASKPGQVAGMAKALITKDQPDVGENAKLDLD